MSQATDHAWYRVDRALTRISRDKWLDPALTAAAVASFAWSAACDDGHDPEDFVSEVIDDLGKEALEVGLIEGKPVAARHHPRYPTVEKLLRGKSTGDAGVELRVLNLLMKGRPT